MPRMKPFQHHSGIPWVEPVNPNATKLTYRSSFEGPFTPVKVRLTATERATLAALGETLRPRFGGKLPSLAAVLAVLIKSASLKGV